MDSEPEDYDAMAEAMGFSSFGAHPAKKRRYNPHSDSSILPAKPASAAQSKPSASGANSAPLGTRAAPAASTNNDEISLDDEEDAGPQGGAELGGPPATLPQRPAVAAPGEAVGEGQQPQQSKPQGHGQGRGGRGQFNPLWYENYYDPTSNANPWDRLERKLGLQPRDPWPPRKSTTPSPYTSTPFLVDLGNARQNANFLQNLRSRKKHMQEPRSPPPELPAGSALRFIPPHGYLLINLRCPLHARGAAAGEYAYLPNISGYGSLDRIT